MKKILTIAVFLIMSMSVIAQVSDNDQIRKNFNFFNNFLLESKGEQAVKYLDSRTIKYYEIIFDQVKKADSSQVVMLPLIDKLTILIARSAAPRNDILHYNQNEFLIYTINKGIFDKTATSALSLGEVTIDNNTAKARLFINGDETESFVNFNKEDGIWKYDLISLFSVNQNILQGVVNNIGIQKIAEQLLDKLQIENQNTNFWKPLIN
jgi:hypothetical protein